MSDDAGDDLGILCDCNGTDNGETNGFVVDVDTRFEISGLKPWEGGGGGKNGWPSCGWPTLWKGG